MTAGQWRQGLAESVEQPRVSRCNVTFIDSGQGKNRDETPDQSRHLRTFIRRDGTSSMGLEKEDIGVNFIPETVNPEYFYTQRQGGIQVKANRHESQMPANQELRGFISHFTCREKPHMLQRTMLRAFVPESELTPVHFDQPYLRVGPPTSLTAWVPDGDVSLEAGGLMYYLEGSTDIGQQTEAEFARNAQNITDEECLGAFNKNTNDGGFLSRDTVAYGKHGTEKVTEPSMKPLELSPASLPMLSQCD